MRVYDGLQRFELHRAGGPTRTAGYPVPAREFRIAMRNGPMDAVERIVDLLVRDFGWSPCDFNRRDAALERVVELIDAGRLNVTAFRPSGSVAGDVPDEDDVQPLSELAQPEPPIETTAQVHVEPPMGIEPAFELTPPPMFEAGFEVEPPMMPEFEFEVG